MKDIIVKLAYRQIITIASKTPFERDVFEDSYNEFLMQTQVYNPEGKFISFQEMVDNNPKANSLHYKVGFAVGLYIKNLNKIIPGLKDTLERTSIPFVSHEFNILESDIKNKSSHKIAITYFTGELTLYDVIGDFLLLAIGNKTSEVPGEHIPTFLLKVRPELSVYSRQEVHHEPLHVSRFTMEKVSNDGSSYQFQQAGA